MGFKMVYEWLQEIFPQVDPRLLRAVAIEHPKDADLAAGIVLTEIIPYMSPRLHSSVIPSQDIDVGSSALHSSVKITKTTDCSCGPDLSVALDESTLSNASLSNDGADKFLGMNEIKEPDVFWNAEHNFTGEISNKFAKETSNDFRLQVSEDFGKRPVHMDDDGENLMSSCICQEMEPEQNYINKEAAFSNNNDNRRANHPNEVWLDFVGPSADDYDASIGDKNLSMKNCETAFMGAESSEAQSGQVHTPNAKDVLQSEFDSLPSGAVGRNLENGYPVLKKDFCISEACDVEDEMGENNAVTQSSQVCRIDLLEEIIDEAKTNKKTLFSSMESLINLMREVELQENAAEQTNMEAARGASDILDRVEEYKKMLAHAKEANDMHAGEVYGEKAILATELRELQSRLLCLSNERDKSLAVLDEMSRSLEARLAAAEELRKSAEHVKMEKETSARMALAEQEAMMEKVVQESARLQQEAEENSKLREFLMDRGRVVDMLQGEISVICHDIRLLKEKFDANLPLSKSLTARQTSCILASSGSSLKSLASDVASEHSDSSGILKTSPAASVASLSSKNGHEEERSKADHKALLDDGWDIFEKDVELNSSV